MTFYCEHLSQQNNMKIAIFMLFHPRLRRDPYICGGGGDIRSTPLNSLLHSARRCQFVISKCLQQGHKCQRSTNNIFSSPSPATLKFWCGRDLPRERLVPSEAQTYSGKILRREIAARLISSCLRSAGVIICGRHYIQRRRVSYHLSSGII